MFLHAALPSVSLSGLIGRAGEHDRAVRAFARTRVHAEIVGTEASMRGAVEELERRLLLAGPSVVSVEADGRRLFVREGLADGSLGAPAALVMRGVNWSPHTAGA